MNRKFIIMLGPPGSGKGTQGKLLAGVLGYGYFSMGQVLREYSKGDSEKAKTVKEMIDNGRIIPDEMIREIFVDQMEKYSDTPCLIIDAFPRDIAQVGILHDAEKKYGVTNLKVIFLDVPKEKLRERIQERQLEAGTTRADDRTQIIDTRFEEYEQKTLPLKDYFQKAGVLIKIQGDQDVEAVHKEILSQIHETRV